MTRLNMNIKMKSKTTYLNCLVFSEYRIAMNLVFILLNLHLLNIIYVYCMNKYLNMSNKLC